MSTIKQILLLMLLSIIGLIGYFLWEKTNQEKRNYAELHVIHFEQMVIEPPSKISDDQDTILSNFKTAIESKRKTYIALAPINIKKPPIKKEKKLIAKTKVHIRSIKKQPSITKTVTIKKHSKKKILISHKSKTLTKSIKTQTKSKIKSKNIKTLKFGEIEVVSISKPFTLEDSPQIKAPQEFKEDNNHMVSIDGLKFVTKLGVVAVSNSFTEENIQNTPYK